MVGSLNSMCVKGIYGYNVSVECYISNGLPNFEIVGLPDTAVKEARERVRAAAKSCGLKFPNGRITVNLAPADLRKSGTHFDLPILLCIMCTCKAVKRPFSKTAFIGEVGLDGTVRAVNGVLSMAIAAKHAGIEAIYVPADNAAEATLARGPAIYPVSNVRDLIMALNEEGPALKEEPMWMPDKSEVSYLDFKDVMGQEIAKRALEIAAAGGHNVLFIGPPGSGKSMLAKRIPSILPDMTWKEALEVTQIYSVMGMLTPDSPMVMRRPFRSPHHTISNAGLIGGGTTPRPGEISMSHKGVLFLDELPEFKRDTLDLMRQPLEDAQVSIARVSGTLTYPAEFMLVCAMNPCKCGWHGDRSGRCTCSQASVDAYRSRISGPLLDRIDIIIELPPVDFELLRNRKEAEPSEKIRERVNAARKIQLKRFDETSGLCNARMNSTLLRYHCVLDDESHNLMKQAFEVYGLTARSYDRILKVARTIADLEGSRDIQVGHVAEAIQYRNIRF